MRRIGYAFVVVVSLIGRVDAGSDRSMVRLAAFDGRGGVIVPVTIDGTGPFMFMLDTGSSRTAIADDLAIQMAAPVVARAEVVSSAGPEVHDVMRLERVEVAGAHAAILLASVIPAARLRAIGSEIRGVVGQDFLSGFNYTLDYQRGRLTWDGTDVASCASRAALPLVGAEGRYLVNVMPERSSRPLRLVPDTGSDTLVLFAPIGDHDRRDIRAAVSITGLTGTARARTVAASKLRVGNVTLRSATTVVVERDGADSDGLLPLHVFASVSFNMQEGCMVVRER